MKLFYTIILILCLINSKGQEVLILDSITNIPIENVTLLTTIKGVSSDRKGIVKLTGFKKTDTILIKHLSYRHKNIIKSEIGKIILLSPKARILPTVMLSESPKIFNSNNYLEIKIVSEESSAKKSTTEILSKNTNITIQESQPGGGSPNFRGLEANRLLLIVDGLSLNNTIYRSGHLQNSSTINPFFIESFSIATGPSSIGFGDGAIGGAILFSTISPKILKNASHALHQQYETSSNAVSLNYKANYSTQKLAFVSGISMRSVGNLKMGRGRMHGYLNWGNEESISKGREQLYTNYDQFDLIHKTFFKINLNTDILLNTQYSTSSNINRFDKLNDVANGIQKYSHWYYGPQNRFLQTLKLNSTKTNIFYDKLQVIFGFQNVTESRHHKKSNDSLLSNRFESVNIYDVSLNFNKLIFLSNLSYGFGGRKQIVTSSANKEAENKSLSYNTTRYPDGGSDVIDLFLYSQFDIAILKNLNLYLGGRLNYNKLNALFTDTQTYHFPFSQIRNENYSFVNSILINYKIKHASRISLAFYSGFRNPNLDDLGKVFSKNDIYVIVPNSNLSPEKSKNIELGFNSHIFNDFKFNFTIFNTIINDAISRENGQLNGQDSIFYDGEKMKIQMNKNIKSINISGLNFAYTYTIHKNLLLASSCNYILGKTSKNYPVAHIPPFNANLNIEYIAKKNKLKFNLHYNGWKKVENYDLAGIDNLEEATIDGTPSWYTINLYYSYKLDDNFTCSLGIKNIFDMHYKTFGSGLSASGRNFILSLYSNF